MHQYQFLLTNADTDTLASKISDINADTNTLLFLQNYYLGTIALLLK